MLAIGKSIITEGRLADINTSSIFTELIQAAGTLCEHYASDIIYDINDITSAINDGENVTFYVGIRQNGVDGTSFMRSRLDESGCCYSPNSYLRIYRISVSTDGETMSVKCDRISEHDAKRELIKEDEE